jgi:hypothetical protein
MASLLAVAIVRSYHYKTVSCVVFYMTLLPSEMIPPWLCPELKDNSAVVDKLCKDVASLKKSVERASDDDCQFLSHNNEVDDHSFSHNNEGLEWQKQRHHRYVPL